jgi:eukaryotic-like serine/threonine-protein kinase
MQGSSVFVVAFFTSVLTAAGTVYVIERYGVLEPYLHRGEKIELTEVPELKGLVENDARENLRAKHLSLMIKGRAPSAEARPGTVLDQSLPPGQRVPTGGAVAVTIAEELPKVPEIVGLTAAEATTKLATLGYKLKLGQSVADANVPEGKVASQDPASGSPLEKNVPVIVQLSSGPGEFEMPKVVGVGLDAAKTQLEKAGLKLAPVRWVSMAETATYVVLSQKPEAGQKVKPGTEVQLTANR